MKRGNQCHEFNRVGSLSFFSDANVLFAEYLKDQVISYKILKNNGALLQKRGKNVLRIGF